MPGDVDIILLTCPRVVLALCRAAARDSVLYASMTFVVYELDPSPLSTLSGHVC